MPDPPARPSQAESQYEATGQSDEEGVGGNILKLPENPLIFLVNAHSGKRWQVKEIRHY